MSSRTNQPSTPQGMSRAPRGSQSTGLSRRGALSVPSLLLDPLGLFSSDSPFSTISRLQQDLNRVFAQGSPATTSGTSEDVPVFVPPVDIEVRDGNIVVTADLAGVDADDIVLEITDDALVIQGERTDEREENEGGVRRRERRYGQFYRAIALPDGVNADDAQAEFDNGVLRITIPVEQAAEEPRRIPVQTSSASSSSASGSTSGSTTDSGSAQASGTQSSQTDTKDQKSSTNAPQKAA